MFKDYSSVKKWESWGFIWIIIIGSLLHFIYKWSNNSPIIGTISPVNESVWEHLKMGYFALLPYSIIEYLFVRNYIENFFFAKLIGIVTMELFIVIVFYLYTYLLNRHILFIDISSFIIGALICQIVSYNLMKVDINRKTELIGFVIYLLIGCVFATLTFFPLRFHIFADPSTGKYGI